jgi:hypothetical protein
MFLVVRCRDSAFEDSLGATMYTLGKDLDMTVPGRIIEGTESDPRIRRLIGSDKHLGIELRLPGQVHVCLLDDTARRLKEITQQTKGHDLIQPDFADRWDKLIADRELADRKLIIKPKMRNGVCELVIEEVVLDIEDPSTSTVPVGGSFRKPIRR